MQIIAAPKLPPFALNKHAFSNRRLIAPAGSNRSTCRNKVRLLCVISEAQYQAFVRFAVASSAAFSAIALKSDLPVGTSTRTGSLVRILASSREFAGRANPVPVL
ncbi:hypothetical protein [Tardiphaga sp.]|uniref:hypothetical protein n=1 Tax=Tardiphaga sp. TaxID=1926292 RepID=UPI00261FB53F|nr:hypothetical protein [Tardiphaga sp.]